MHPFPDDATDDDVLADHDRPRELAAYEPDFADGLSEEAPTCVSAELVRSGPPWIGAHVECERTLVCSDAWMNRSWLQIPYWYDRNEDSGRSKYTFSLR